MAQRLLNKTALVTGGSSGIGLAIAERFAAEGCKKIILVARTHEKLQALRQKHEKQELGMFEYRARDVASEECWGGLKGEMHDIDILVNAAGISQSSYLVRTQNEQIDNILQTNLTATVLACKAMAKAMLSPRPARPAGYTACIINVSSLLGIKGGQGAAVYAASKAGVLGLTRALTTEASEFTGMHVGKLRVNAIVPGYIDTPMLKGFSAQTREDMTSQIPLKRFGTPEEVADAAVFLATNQYANNCVLNLDGGLSAT